jgi:hypothetical protein
VSKGVLREPLKDGKSEYYFATGRGPSTETLRARDLGGLLPAIKNAGHAGLSLVEIEKQFGKLGAREAELGEELDCLVGKGDIRKVLTDGNTDHYFAAGRGPTAQTVSTEVVRLVLQSGLHLATAASLKKALNAVERMFLDEALELALKSGEIAELTCGKTKCYLHREAAARRFGSGSTQTPPDVANPPPESREVTLEQVLPVYRRLKAEQGGFSGVKIFDLIKALNRPKDAVHPLLLREVKAGRITIHRSSSVELSREVTEAGIRLPGFADPFVTFAVKKDR